MDLSFSSGVWNKVKEPFIVNTFYVTELQKRSVRLGARLSNKTALSRNVERPLEYMIRYMKGSQ
jgi:hypothetical protein